jgi:hypothetical protein
MVRRLLPSGDLSGKLAMAHLRQDLLERLVRSALEDLEVGRIARGVDKLRAILASPDRIPVAPSSPAKAADRDDG